LVTGRVEGIGVRKNELRGREQPPEKENTVTGNEISQSNYRKIRDGWKSFSSQIKTAEA